MSNFITFGCWNKWYCNPGPKLSNPLSNVIAKMDSYIHTLGSKNKPSFICVAGDNYYPEIVGKGKDKKKHLSFPDLKSGFECLKQFHVTHRDIPIDIIAGNHDTEKTSHMVIIPPDDTSPGQRDPCLITKAEIESTRDTPTMNFTMFNYRVMGDTLVIMVDSNIYVETIDASELKCYAELVDHTLSILNLRKLHHHGSPITNVNQLKAIQLAWLETVYEAIVGHEFKNVMIVAHHPLASYKIKDEDFRYDKVDPDYAGFCYSIYHYLKNFNGAVHFFYSCADLHTYQSGIVTINFGADPITINQEIAGTGGTALEKEHADFDSAGKHESKRKTTRGLVLEYQMTNAHHSHGFLHWSDKSGKLSARFIPVEGVHSETDKKDKKGGTKRFKLVTKRRRQRASKRRSNRQCRMPRSRSRSRPRH